MKPRLLSSRPSVTRTSRRDPRGSALESVAAEFALLAQRRARLARQLDLLGRQLDAASASMDAVQARMVMLARRIDAIDPALRPMPAPPAVAAYPAPAPAALRAAMQPPRVSAAAMYQAAQAPDQKGARPQHALGMRAPRALLRRRPFPPE